MGALLEDDHARPWDEGLERGGGLRRRLVEPPAGEERRQADLPETVAAIVV